MTLRPSNKVVVLTLAILTCLSEYAGAQQAEVKTIVLKPTATCSRCGGGPSGEANEADAKVTVKAFPTGDSNVHLNVRGLRSFGPSEPATFALYLSTSANPEIDGGAHPFRFNVNWDGGIVLQTGFASATEIPFDQLKSAFVVIEPDDNRTFDPSTDGHLIQLVGTVGK